MELRSTNENAYFAASNSEKGFYSYYGECFQAERIEYVYAIKGGPGTGKSRFLREVAGECEQRGGRVEYIYCSSDPDSLDGIILTHEKRCVALMDATAPHVYEPTLVGIRGELVDLGAFWNAEVLQNHAREITLLDQQKRQAYRRAYRYLCAEGEMMRECDALTLPYIGREAIAAFAERITRKIPDGSGFTSSPALLCSVGMRGEVIFDTYFANAEQCWLIQDCYGAGQVFLAAIGEAAVKHNWRIRVSHDPVYPDRLDGIFLEESRSAFVIKPEKIEYPHAKTLSMRRFVKVCAMRPIRGRYRFANRLRQALREGALDALREVRELHFALEELYIGAMDFDAKENFTKNFCRRLFDLKKR